MSVIRTTSLILLTSLVLPACTHRIKAPTEPIRVDVTVTVKHEVTLDGDLSG